MKLSNEQIASILIKDVSAKTILVDQKEVDETIDKYNKDGWKLVNKTPLGERYKLTFSKVK